MKSHKSELKLPVFFGFFRVYFIPRKVYDILNFNGLSHYRKGVENYPC
jgi:hypothetical protein